MTTAAERTVLVVDDEEGLRLFLQTALEDAGFNVETAGDGIEALEKVKNSPPDIISLDLVMPKRSGAKFLHEVRKNREWQRIPVILVTAHAKDELGKDDFDDIMANRMLSGPGCYLEKPVNAETYVNSIRRALGMETTESSAASKDPRKELDSLLEHTSETEMQEILDLVKKKKSQ